MKIQQICNLIDSKLEFITPDGHFEGIVKLVLIEKARVTFEHVFDLPSRYYLGTMHILLSDISSCKLLEPADRILDYSKFDSSKELLSGGLEDSSRIDKTKTIQVNPGSYFFNYLPPHLQSKCPDDYCIIDSLTATFHRAVVHLSELSVVGVSFHGAKISRCGNFSWICMASSVCVFMFDVEQLGIAAFQQGLKKIFENEEVVKVIHDCREAADCLMHRFQTNLANVFDTQVADFLINMQMYTGKKIFNYVSSLHSCLVKYLKVPQQFLYNRNKCISFDDELKFYKVRPICNDLINVLVTSSMYLVLLKEIEEELLLYPFEQAVDLYLNILRTATDSDVYREPTQFTQIAPDYLLDSIKIVRFYDLPQPPDDFVSKFKETLHGRKVWNRKMQNASVKCSKSSSDLNKDVI